MAGGHNPPTISMDPALVKYNNMATNRYKYFRFTPRTAWITFAYVVLVPSVVGHLGFRTDGKWEMRGKLRGDTVSEW